MNTSSPPTRRSSSSSLHRLTLYPALLAALGACGEPGVIPPDECVAETESALQPVNRLAVGQSAAYPADAGLRLRDKELKQSVQLRREVGWSVAERVLADVPFAAPPPGAATLPVFATWADHNDLRRIFHRLYGALSPQRKADRSRFSSGELDDGFEWNVSAVEEQPGWETATFEAYLAEAETAEEARGLGEISRVLYSPAAGRHVLSSYPEVLACRSQEMPEPLIDAEAPAEEVFRRTEVLDACERRKLGEANASVGEWLTVTALPGDGGAIEVSSEARRCRPTPGAPCEFRGPTSISLVAQATSEPVEARVAVSRRTPTPTWATCLNGPFPFDAAVIKTSYRRIGFGFEFPVYDTDAPSLGPRVVDRGSWLEPDRTAEPGSDAIYTVETQSGGAYRLAGLHIMTKELDHWVWVTLWWSDRPNEDFGEDRPSSPGSLWQDSVWKNYKMCVVTAFEDPTDGSELAELYPTLAAALSKVSAERAGPSWCSNPYIEEGTGNAATNCIGCHQHGGLDLLSEDVISDPVRFPRRGTTQLRNNFPADYAWTTTQGDDWSQLFHEEEEYYQE